ncbi:MAG: phospho-sugar mutase [Gammaproteobacteria bacterium]|nr:phospho-sugar mutase [Gammaproteobacteria bacterium]
MTTFDDLLDTAAAWIAGDPDPATRKELQAVIDSGDFDDLADRMHGTLEFGTAGLRGIVGAGSNRMNRAVIIRATRGVADHVLANNPGLVVVGRDARLSSPQFLEDTIAVLAAAGVPVQYFDAPVATPIVAYAARVLGAQAGIIITASHNPADYNGYKVYASNAVQIVPPTDTEIAAAIDRVGPAVEVPRHDDPFHADGVERIPDDLLDRYLADLQEARGNARAEQDLRIVYTPMHGVGWRFFEKAMHRAGYRHVAPVPEQVEPDGHFPTTHFPNPEEPGALDLAIALAERTDADIILSNDPDADRLAVALPFDGTWGGLTGNQIGCLLADYVLERWPDPDRPMVIESIVSSPMLASIAQHHGAHFDQTLTGFKWIWNAALDLEAAGTGRFAFGYEEALGYSVGRAVRDKDGISAAVVFADLASACRAEGITVLDRLERLYRNHGLWVSTQKSIVRPGAEGIAEIDAAMALLEERVPGQFHGRAVLGATDFRVGADRRPRWLGATPLVAFDLDGDARVLIRPSGTEPKLKIYVDLRAHLGPDDSVTDVEQDALEAATRIAEAAAAFVGLA